MNKTLSIALLLAGLVLISCSREKKEAGSAAPAKRSAITIKGSDTLVLLAQRLAESFMAKNPGESVQVTGGGSGTGIASLINGSTQIATMSRPMTASEKTQVEARRGKPAVEHAVALDGIAIYVHEKNPIQALDLQQIKGIFSGEIRDWSEVGGAPGRISLYSRENNSGTYAYFKEEVLKNDDFAAEAQTLPGTAAVVNAVAKDPLAIGYGGIAYSTGVKALGVKKDPQSAAVVPTEETVTDGAYPISRKLFMVTAGEPEGPVATFLAFARSAEGQKIAASTGYYPLPAEKP